MTKLRVSSHRLEVETGRWHKPRPVPVIERKCKQCYKLEDEFHFFLEYPLYTKLRHFYIRPFFWTNTNSQKFRGLFNSTCKQINLTLAANILKPLNNGQLISDCFKTCYVLSYDLLICLIFVSMHYSYTLITTCDTPKCRNVS